MYRINFVYTYVYVQCIRVKVIVMIRPQGLPSHGPLLALRVCISFSARRPSSSDAYRRSRRQPPQSDSVWSKFECIEVILFYESRLHTPPLRCQEAH